MSSPCNPPGVGRPLRAHRARRLRWARRVRLRIRILRPRCVRPRTRLLRPPCTRRPIAPAVGCAAPTLRARKMTRTARTGTPPPSAVTRTMGASSARGASPRETCRLSGVAPAVLLRRLPSRWPSVPNLAASVRESDPTVPARICAAVALPGATAPMLRGTNATGVRPIHAPSTAAVAWMSIPVAARRASEGRRMGAEVVGLRAVPPSIDGVRLKDALSVMIAGVRVMSVTNAMIAGLRRDAVRARRRSGHLAAQLRPTRRGGWARGMATDRPSTGLAHVAIPVETRGRPGAPGYWRPARVFPIRLLRHPASLIDAGSWCAIRTACTPTGR
jgi:hypothetical protein